jgi:hypothetical protein
VVDVDPGFYVRFADLFQIEGTAGRFMLKQMALRLSSRPASSLIAPRQRSSPTSAVARSWGLSCWRQAHAKARQKGAKANAEAPQLRAHRVQASGATSLRAIASALNDRGIPTARGGKWFAASVRDVLARI